MIQNESLKIEPDLAYEIAINLNITLAGNLINAAKYRLEVIEKLLKERLEK